MSNKKTIGNKNIKPIECINSKLHIYRIRWDFETYYDEYGDEYVKFMEEQISHKPHIDEIKSIIINYYNDKINEKIYTGFIWNGYNIFLSTENQFNYKAAYDLAFQTNGANLPLKFKFGSTLEPKYYTFNTLEELQNFYIEALNYITNVLYEGWTFKDNIDWSIYENI